jgi:hypothetical protein
MEGHLQFMRDFVDIDFFRLKYLSLNRTLGILNLFAAISSDNSAISDSVMIGKTFTIGWNSYTVGIVILLMVWGIPATNRTPALRG